jgi:hypothetical protein
MSLVEQNARKILGVSWIIDFWVEMRISDLLGIYGRYCPDQQ